MKNAILATLAALTILTPTQPSLSQTQSQSGRYGSIPVWVVEGDTSSRAMDDLQVGTWRQDVADSYGVALFYQHQYWRSYFDGRWEQSRGFKSRRIFVDCNTGRGYYIGTSLTGQKREGTYSAAGDVRRTFWRDMCASTGYAMPFW